MTRKERFAAVMAALGEAFDKALTTTRMAIYERALEDVPIEEIEHHAWRLIKRNIYFPKPVELRNDTGEVLELRAAGAFDEVTRAIGRVGQYNSVEFTDVATFKAIEAMGGWIGVCMKDSEWWHNWGRKEFSTLYKMYVGVAIGPGVRPYLPGRTEMEGGNIKYGVTPIVYLVGAEIRVIPEDTTTPSKLGH